jgi:hypothetical protein
VDIETIVEFELGLNIFPFPNLQTTFDIEGFISGDLTVIYVDEFIYHQRPARYRFTLACNESSWGSRTSISFAGPLTTLPSLKITTGSPDRFWSANTPETVS